MQMGATTHAQLRPQGVGGQASDGGGDQAVQGGRKRMSFGKKKKADLTEGDWMFDTLVEKLERSRRGERVENMWIKQPTWELVDRRTQLRREGKLILRRVRSCRGGSRCC